MLTITQMVFRKCQQVFPLGLISLALLVFMLGFNCYHKFYKQPQQNDTIGSVSPPGFATEEMAVQRRTELQEIFTKKDLMGWNSLAILQVCGLPLSMEVNAFGEVVWHYSVDPHEGYVKFWPTKEFGLVCGYSEFWK